MCALALTFNIAEPAFVIPGKAEFLTIPNPCYNEDLQHYSATLKECEANGYQVPPNLDQPSPKIANNTLLSVLIAIRSRYAIEMLNYLVSKRQPFKIMDGSWDRLKIAVATLTTDPGPGEAHHTLPFATGTSWLAELTNKYDGVACLCGCCAILARWQLVGRELHSREPRMCLSHQENLVLILFHCNAHDVRVRVRAHGLIGLFERCGKLDVSLGRPVEKNDCQWWGNAANKGQGYTGED